jgi:hypothetical protein
VAAHERRDVRRVVQRNDARLEFVRHLRAAGRLAAHEGLRRRVPGRAQMVGAQQRAAEGAPVVDHAADRDAAEAHAVEGALAADEQRALRLAAGPRVGQCDLQSGVAGFRAAVGEEHAVQPGRREVGQPLGQLERTGVTDLEARREVERVDLALHRLGDARMAMPGADAPQPRRAVEHRAPLGRAVGDALGRSDQARRLLELPVRRERHPERVERARSGHFEV